MTVAKPEEPGKSDAGLPPESAFDPQFDGTVPPMTWSLMGRFFAVPFLIILVIVVGAVTVVFLFGGPAAPPTHTVDELLTAVESVTWQRTAGMLLPQEKELLQKAIELSVRLEKKDQEFSPEDIAKITQRLVTLVDAQIINADASPPPNLAPDELAARVRRMEFLIHALGRTGQPEAVATLVNIVKLNRVPFVTTAVQELGNLHKLPEARAAANDVAGLLSASPNAETAMVAATALSVLSDPDNQQVIASLKTLMFANEGEVSWSAAMALARLGDPSGKMILLDLLDRNFWQSGERYQTTDKSGVTHRYPMPPQRIDALLLAAIDASAHLQNKDLWDAIETLKSDPSPSVRTKATEVATRRPATTASG